MSLHHRTSLTALALLSSVALALGEKEDAHWLPNLHFGSGVGGWERTTLYAMSLDPPRLFALKVGVPGATRL